MGNDTGPVARMFALGPFRLRDVQRVAVWVIIIAGFLGLLLLGVDSLTHRAGGAGGAAPGAGPAISAGTDGGTAAGQPGAAAPQAPGGDEWAAGEYSAPASAAGVSDGAAGVAPPGTPGAAALEEWQTALEVRLSSVLSRIAGAGRVTVWVTLAAGPELVPLSQETVHTTLTDERDAGGGTRTVRDEERTVQVVTDGGTSSALGAGAGGRPLLEQVLAPRVAGVLVIAEGAGDPRVRAQLAAAAAAALGLPVHRVVVLPAAAGGG